MLLLAIAATARSDTGHHVRVTGTHAACLEGPVLKSVPRQSVLIYSLSSSVVQARAGVLEPASITLKESTTRTQVYSKQIP
jgi:hypothetical protein